MAPVEETTPRLKLSELAKYTPEEIRAKLYRALPSDSEDHPPVAAFNSSI